MKEIIDELCQIRHIIKYVVSKHPKKDKTHEEMGKLEERVLKEKLNKKQPENLDFLEEVLSHLKNTSSKGLSIDIKKEIQKAQSLVIKYHENEREERITVEAEDENNQMYSFSILKEKTGAEKPYQLDLTYESKKTEERLTIRYDLRDYPTERDNSLQDFTSVLDKTLHILPKSLMGGVLGYTYLGENFMARRDDLFGDMAKMVDVHESIHTPDEYETRLITSWMLKKEAIKYKR